MQQLSWLRGSISAYLANYYTRFRLSCERLCRISTSRSPLCLFSPYAINQPRQFVMASHLVPRCPAFSRRGRYNVHSISLRPSSHLKWLFGGFDIPTQTCQNVSASIKYLFSLSVLLFKRDKVSPALILSF
jgi:hypothetical protein